MMEGHPLPTFGFAIVNRASIKNAPASSLRMAGGLRATVFGASEFSRRF
jgi:hypothetical protein